MSESSSWFVYILETEKGFLYTGITNNLEKRFKTHVLGRGAKYLRANKPSKLVYIETSKNRSEASKREAQIKKMKRAQKLSLIKSCKQVIQSEQG